MMDVKTFIYRDLWLPKKATCDTIILVVSVKPECAQNWT